MYNSDLYHHGVKGQKWGVRRYQNKDGSLTPAGVRKYQSSKNKQVDRNSFMRTAARFGKGRIKMLEHPADAIKLEFDINKAKLKHPAGYIKYVSRNQVPLLAGPKREEFMKTLNAHMDSINDDFSKIKIGEDFFKKHYNDTIDDILSDGNNAMVAFYLFTRDKYN